MITNHFNRMYDEEVLAYLLFECESVTHIDIQRFPNFEGPVVFVLDQDNGSHRRFGKKIEPVEEEWSLPDAFVPIYTINPPLRSRRDYNSIGRRTFITERMSDRTGLGDFIADRQVDRDEGL